MAAGKRASMREGPLAALFRKTEQDSRAAAHAAEQPLEESAHDDAPRHADAGAEAEAPRRATEPAAPDRALREPGPVPVPAADPAPPRHPRESGVPHPALGTDSQPGAEATTVPTPQERLRAAFSSELPEDILERAGSGHSSPIDVYARAEYSEPRSTVARAAAAARRRRRRRRRQRRQPDGRGGHRRRRVHRRQHRPPVAAAVHRGRHRPHRRPGHARPRLGRERRARPPRRDGGVRQGQVAAEGLGHDLHHRRRGRRHRHRRGARRRADRARGRRADGRHRDQAVRLRGHQARPPGRGRDRGARRPRSTR